MTESLNPDLVAEVTAFVNALDRAVLYELCEELEPVKDVLGQRDQVLLMTAQKRLAAIDVSQDVGNQPPIVTNLKAFERP